MMQETHLCPVLMKTVSINTDIMICSEMHHCGKTTDECPILASIRYISGTGK